MFWTFFKDKINELMPDKRSAQSGFGLIELMVSIGIVVLVMGIVFTRQDAFNSALLLRNEAFDVALNARDMQLSALGAEGRDGVFRSLVGLHFDTDQANNQVYIPFIDTNADGVYDAASEGTGEIFRIDPRFEINQLRVDGADVSVATAVFQRPNFDAVINPGDGDILEIDLTLIADNMSTTTIVITSTGQISVESP